MRRRDILCGAGVLTTAVTASVPAPTIAQSRRQLRMVTDWPADMPGLQTSAVRFAKSIAHASAGRINVEVFPAGELVRALETFDAVSAGVADMYHSYEGYFAPSKSPALYFFSAIPLGFTANELIAWIQYGGGQELWDALSGQFNIKALLCCSTGCQMGGWFAREIVAPEQYKGLRYRMAGPGAEVLRRLGATVVTLPGGDIMPALRSGAIDASEWIGPWLDMAIGLHEAVGYYYYPGFHEPGAGMSLGINRRVWDSFDTGDQQLIEAMAACEYTRSLAEFNANNSLSLQKLREAGKTKIQKFDDSLLKAQREVSREVVAEIGSGDELARKIYASYQQFRGTITDWSDISERAVLNSRALT